LLTAEERTILLNILRRLDGINYLISRLDFGFEKSYNNNLSSENRDRLQQNYLSTCQKIGDQSYQAAREIAHLLRQGKKEAYGPKRRKRNENNCIGLL
jgi:hypothetical protein